MCVCLWLFCTWSSKNNRSFDTPVKGPPQGPRLHIDIPRVQLLIEDKEGIKQIGQCLHVGLHICKSYAIAIYIYKKKSYIELSWFLKETLMNRKRKEKNLLNASSWHACISLLCVIGEDKATIPVTDTEFSQSVNPQSFCTGVSVHHPALIQNTGPLIDMSDIRPGTSMSQLTHSFHNRWKMV